MQSMDRPHRLVPRGAEAWLPQIILAVTSLAVVAALGYFILIARPMRGRIPLPAWTIPLATIFAAGLAAYLTLRSALLIRSALKALRRRDSNPDLR